MAIEPIGTAMTFQAQPVAPVKPTPPVKTEDYTSVDTTDPAAKLDGQDLVVKNAQEKGNSNEGQDERQPSSSEQIRKAVEKLNQAKADSEAIFGIHEGTNRVTIKIVDKKTKEIIKELPPEKTLDMIARVWEMAGLMVDEKR